jgi:hypothetical protein
MCALADVKNAQSYFTSSGRPLLLISRYSRSHDQNSVVVASHNYGTALPLFILFIPLINKKEAVPFFVPRVLSGTRRLPNKSMWQGWRFFFGFTAVSAIGMGLGRA